MQLFNYSFAPLIRVHLVSYGSVHPPERSAAQGSHELRHMVLSPTFWEHLSQEQLWIKGMHESLRQSTTE